MIELNPKEHNMYHPVNEIQEVPVTAEVAVAIIMSPKIGIIAGFIGDIATGRVPSATLNN